jgi:hypothetical protein
MVAMGVLLAAASASAQSGAVVAVFDVDARDIDLPAPTLDAMADYICKSLTTAGFQVIPRQVLARTIAARKGPKKDGCKDLNCQMDAARRAKAEKSLSIRVVKVGETCRFLVTLYDIGSQASEAAGMAAGGCLEEDVITMIDGAVGQLRAAVPAAAGPEVPGQSGPSGSASGLQVIE